MARVSSIDPSGHFDHSYARIHHLIVEEFAFEVHHGLVVTFFFEDFFDTVVIQVLPATLKTLKKRVFFPVHCIVSGAIIDTKNIGTSKLITMFNSVPWEIKIHDY